MRGILTRAGEAILVLLVATSAASAAGDPAAGKALAERSCSSCHLVSSDQTAATTEAPPFATIAARPEEEIEHLQTFLAAPHPPMPPISLTRQEIGDLVAYIETPEIEAVEPRAILRKRADARIQAGSTGGFPPFCWRAAIP